MGEDQSNGRPGDTLESLEAERQDLEKTVACVRQMTRDFDALTDQEKSFDPKRVAFHLQLKGPDLRRCVWKGILTPEAFQWHKAAMAREKALGEDVLKDLAAFGQALIRWAEDLERRERQYTALATTVAVGATIQAPTSSSPSLESPSRAGEPGAAPEPGASDVPNLGPATVVTGGAAAAAAASVTWALTFSEVMGKREANIIKYGNPYGPPSQYAHASSYTGGSSEDQSDVQKGRILYDGERRGQDGTAYTKDGQIAVHANGTSALSIEERQEIAQQSGNTSDVLRNTPGTVTNTAKLTPASGNWLNAAKPTAIPAQVADQLVGRTFNSFSDFRAAFWQAVAADPDLRGSFGATSLANMQIGNAPFAPRAMHINESDAGMRFNLHHVQPIQSGGAIYDLGNLEIVSPAFAVTLDIK